VLESARAAFWSGLAFDASNVGVVLNVAADHGVAILTHRTDGSSQGVVAEAVLPNGYAVLNADDPLVAAMQVRVKSQLAYFTMNPENR